MKNWIDTLINIHSDIQAIVVLALIISVGLVLGKVRVRGVSLGVTFVFFTGILAGHFGLTIDRDVLEFAESLGLSMFVYVLGLAVGPNFFSSLRNEGVGLNLWSLGVIVVDTLLVVVFCWLSSVSISDMVGILCGATTNTPALGAAQQTLAQIGKPADSIALACAVTYPLGVVGVILAMIILRKLFVKPQDLVRKNSDDGDHTTLGQYIVANPAVHCKTIMEVRRFSHFQFIISRIWRGDEVIVPQSNTRLFKDDSLIVVCNKDDVEAMQILFGKKAEKDWNGDKVDWNAIDANVESRIIVMTQPRLNGKKLGSLHLHDSYGVNVSRVTRGDIRLLATDDLRLQYGDRVVVVGDPKSIDQLEKFLGNAVNTLNEPNLAAIFLGLIIGLAVGTIPFDIPGMSAPVRLGIAGGPILVSIIIAALGPRVHFISYMTRSAGLMLRKLGLSLYLAGLGLASGAHFFDTVVRPEGLLWIGLGFFITFFPVLVIGLVMLKRKSYDFGSICGILCGSMANPMALNYANETIESDSPSVCYATVYPLGIFMRLLIAQCLIVFFA